MVTIAITDSPDGTLSSNGADPNPTSTINAFTRSGTTDAAGHITVLYNAPGSAPLSDVVDASSGAITQGSVVNSVYTTTASGATNLRITFVGPSTKPANQTYQFLVEAIDGNSNVDATNTSTVTLTPEVGGNLTFSLTDFGSHGHVGAARRRRAHGLRSRHRRRRLGYHGVDGRARFRHQSRHHHRHRCDRPLRGVDGSERRGRCALRRHRRSARRFRQPGAGCQQRRDAGSVRRRRQPAAAQASLLGPECDPRERTRHRRGDVQQGGSDSCARECFRQGRFQWNCNGVGRGPLSHREDFGRQHGRRRRDATAHRTGVGRVRQSGQRCAGVVRRAGRRRFTVAADGDDEPERAGIGHAHDRHHRRKQHRQGDDSRRESRRLGTRRLSGDDGPGAGRELHGDTRVVLLDRRDVGGAQRDRLRRP